MLLYGIYVSRIYQKTQLLMINALYFTVLVVSDLTVMFNDKVADC